MSLFRPANPGIQCYACVVCGALVEHGDLDVHELWHDYVRMLDGQIGLRALRRQNVIWFGDATRTLREVEAKRRRLERHRPVKDPLDVDGYLAADVCEHCAELWPCPDICDDASVYAGHADYRPEWAPQG